MQIYRKLNAAKDEMNRCIIKKRLNYIEKWEAMKVQGKNNNKMWNKHIFWEENWVDISCFSLTLDLNEFEITSKISGDNNIS